MAEQTATFPFSIGEKVKVIETDRDAWVISLLVGADGLQQLCVNTTKATSEPVQQWLRPAELAAIVE